MAAVKKQKGNVDDVIEAMDNIDEAELTKSQKDEAIADFRQEIRVLKNLRCVPVLYMCHCCFEDALVS